MPTLKAETVDDINNALSQLWRLPPQHRARYLSKARNKLRTLSFRGENVQDMLLEIERMHLRHKRLQKKKQQQHSIVDKGLYHLEVGEATYPQSERYRGLLVVHGKDGFYATDGKARTRAYSGCRLIPDEEIAALVDKNNP